MSACKHCSRGGIISTPKISIILRLAQRAYDFFATFYTKFKGLQALKNGASEKFRVFCRKAVHDVIFFFQISGEQIPPCRALRMPIYCCHSDVTIWAYRGMGGGGGWNEWPLASIHTCIFLYCNTIVVSANAKSMFVFSKILTCRTKFFILEYDIYYLKPRRYT